MQDSVNPVRRLRHVYSRVSNNIPSTRGFFSILFLLTYSIALALLLENILFIDKPTSSASNITQEIDYIDPADYTYDNTKINIGAGGASLISVDNTNFQDTEIDLNSSSDYDFQDSSKLGIDSGSAKLLQQKTPLVWYSTGGTWNYRKKITIDGSKITENLSNFPVYINLADMPVEFFSNVKADGSDIVVTSSDGITKLSRELVSIDTVNKVGELWFKAPSLSTGTNTSFFIYYGNSSGAEANTSQVWDSNYVIVKHLDTITDSTSNTNAGSFSGTSVSTGKLGKSRTLNGTSDSITINHSANFNLSSFSVSIWFKYEGAGTGGKSYWTIFNKNSVGIGYADTFHTWVLASNQNVSSRIGNNVATEIGLDTNTSVSDGAWHNIVITRNDTTVKSYLDGILKDTDSVASYSNTDPIIIGYWPGYGNYFKGSVDEFRYANSAFSDGWLYSSYQNQNSSSTFYSIAPGELYPTGSTYLTTNNNTQRSVSDWSQISSISISQNQPESTSLKYLISFDGRNTWKYWNGSSWQNSSLNNIATEGMTKDTLEGINSAQFSASGGFQSGSTTTLDFAVNLNTIVENAAPSLDQLNISYSANGYSAENPSIISKIGYPYTSILGFTEVLGSGNEGTVKYQFSNGDPDEIATWHAAGWSNRKKITVDHTKVVTDQTNFPIYVNLNDLGDSLFLNTKADGTDIIVVDSNGTKLQRDISGFNSVNKTGSLWFKVPLLSSTIDSIFYIYYGNNSANEINGSVYENAAGIWHLDDPNSTGAYITDRSGNNRNGTPTGTSLTDAKLGKGRTYNGTSDYITLGTDLFESDAQGTISAWVNFSNNGNNIPIFSSAISNSSDGMYFMIFNTTRVAFQAYKQGSYNDVSQSTGTFAQGSWHYVSITSNGSTYSIYIDGVKQTTSQIVGSNSGRWFSLLTAANHTSYIGRWQISFENFFFKGIMDEVRIYNTALNENRIITEFNNQNSPNTFYTVSTPHSWFYFNGSNWTQSSGEYENSNTSEEVNNAASQFTEDVGIGDLYIKAFLHSDGSQKVELQSNTVIYTYQPAPVIDSLSTNTGNILQQLSLSINGSNFVSGTSVKLTGSGLPDITCNVSAFSNNQITCLLNLLGSTAGVYNITITNPDGRSTTSINAFTINSDVMYFNSQTDVNNNPIGIGAQTNASIVRFGVWTRSGTTQKLQVEIQPSGSNFTGTATVTGAQVTHLASSPVLATADVDISGYANGSYHWRARLVDGSNAAITNWISYPSAPSNAESDADFVKGGSSVNTNIYPDLLIDRNWTLNQPATSKLYGFGNVTLTGTSQLTVAGDTTLDLKGNFQLNDTSILYTNSANNSAQVGGQWLGRGVNINAANITIASGASINGNGKGYTLGKGPSPGTAEGGAGHGGSGRNGRAFWCSTSNGGSAYGSASSPLDLGSASVNSGSLGGSAVKLNVAGTLIHNGLITMNGSGIGGAGGSIWVIADTISGSGTMTANGSNGGGFEASSPCSYVGYYGAGSGGRIAVYYNTDTSFTGKQAALTVNLGSTGLSGGTAGTVVYKTITSTKVNRYHTQLKTTGEPIGTGGTTNETSIVLGAWTESDSAVNETQKLEIEVKPIGTAFDGTGTTISSNFTHDVATQTLMSVSVSGLSAGSYHWRARTVDVNNNEIRGWSSYPATDTNGENTADFIIGASYIDTQVYPSLTINSNWTLPKPSSKTYYYKDITVTGSTQFTIAGDTTLKLKGNLELQGTSILYANSSDNSAQVSGAWVGRGVSIEAANINIASGTSINGNGKGYTLGKGPSSGTAEGGAGYGGNGMNGRAFGCSTSTGGTSYGSASAPIDLGSASNNSGSLGGSAIKLTVSNTFTHNGTITMNGSGIGGAGGSIWVIADTISGSGTMTANGSNGGGFEASSPCSYVGYYGAGSGGRIAIFFNSDTNYTGKQASLTAALGSTGLSGGTNGTVLYKSLTATQYVVKLPNQTFNDGSNVSGTPSTQIHNQPFDIELYAVTDEFTLSNSYINTAKLVFSDSLEDVAGCSNLTFVNGHASCSATISRVGQMNLRVNSLTGNSITGLSSNLLIYTDQPAPEISSFSPDSVNNSTAVDFNIELNGNYFDSAANIKLVSGATEISAHSVSFVDASQMIAIFNTDSISPGLWKIKLINPDTREVTSSEDLAIGNILFTNPADNNQTWYQGEENSIQWNSNVQIPVKLSYSTDNFTTEEVLLEGNPLLPVDSDTIALYHMENNWNSDTGNTNGTATGATFSTGRIGQYSGNFDGNDFVTLGDSLDNFIAGADKKFTIEAWIKPGVNNMLNNIILGKEAHAGCSQNQTQYGFRLGNGSSTANVLSFYYYGSTNSTNSRAISGTTVLQAGTWYHVAAVYDGSIDSNNGLDRVKLYINGKQDNTSITGSNGNVGDIQDSTAHLGIGNLLTTSGTACGNYYFNGVIDELRISNIARNQEQIRDYFNVSQGKYLWTIPSELSGEIKVRIDSRDYTSLFDTKTIQLDSPYEISLTQPKDGDYLSQNTTHTIDGNFTANSPNPTSHSLALDSSLKASWSLNESSGSTAVSRGSCGSNCNGTLSNFSNTTGRDVISNSGWTANKKYGSGALNFDGSNDFVYAGQESAFDFERNNTFSLSVWVKLTPKGSGDQFLLAKQENSGNYRGFNLVAGDTQSDQVFFALSNSGTVYNIIQGTTDVIDQNWHHIAATSDGTGINGMKIYVDGKLETTSIFGSSLGSNTILNNAPFTIGSRENGGVPSNGTIDEVKVFTKVLSQAEISKLYAADFLKLSYSRDDFNTETVIFDDIAEWLPPYSFNVGTIETGELKLRLVSKAQPNISDEIQVNIQNTPVINITSPNGGETLSATSQKLITWNNTGQINLVNLYYSTNNFSTKTTIAEDLANTGSFTWSIPEEIGDSYKIKIESAFESEIFDESNSTFRVVSNLDLFSPDGYEDYIPGESVDIQWETFGPITNVKIAISNDNFNTSEVIESSIPNTNEYIWQVPGTITGQPSNGTNWKIRVYDVSDEEIYDTSTQPFTIKAARISSPTTSDILQYNEVSNITILKGAGLANVNLYYKIGNGAEVLITSNLSTTSFSWTVDSSVTDELSIVMRNSTNDELVDTVSGISVSAMNAISGIQISNPGLEDSLVVGSNVDIIWDSSALWPLVDIAYSNDNFNSDVHFIATMQTNDGELNWTVPDFINTGVKIRIISSHLATDRITSEAFNIVGAINITSPSASSINTVGTTLNIEWDTTGTIGSSFKLQYSKDNFTADIHDIIDSQPKDGSYTWTVPDDISDTVRVRVLNQTPFFTAVSGQFSISGTINITSPESGQTFYASEDNAITWNSSGTFNLVNIYYAENSSATYQIIGLNESNDGSFIWTGANTLSNTAKFRIQASAAPNTRSEVTGVKQYGRIDITSPEVGNLLPVGSSTQITWTNTGNVSNVDILYSVNDGAYSLITTKANDGSYNWIIPDNVNVNTKILVRNSAFTEMSVIIGSLSIVGDVNFIYPVDGGSLVRNSIENIVWESLGVSGTLKLEYSNNLSEWITISDDISGTNYEWQTPNSLSIPFHLRLTSNSNPEVNQTVSLESIVNIAIWSPVLNEKITQGSNYTINYSVAAETTLINLYYSTNNGVSWTSIANNIAVNDSSDYNWTAPNIYSASTRIKIEDANNTSDSNISSSFAIAAELSFSNPESNELYIQSRNKNINWTTNGSGISNVKLEYSIDNGSTFNTITASTSNDGSYTWSVPAVISNNSKIKITGVEQPEENTVSSTFKIDTPIDITSPIYSTDIRVGQSLPITISRGSLQGATRVTLQISTDNGVNWITIGTTSGNTIFWFVPDIINPNSLVNNVYLRLMAKGSEYDRSDALTVRGKAVITSPTSSSKLSQNGNSKITWTKQGNMPALNLYYSSDGFATQTLLASNLTGNEYNWNITQQATTNAKLKLCSGLELSSDCFYSQIFTITPIKVLFPNLNQTIVKGTVFTIQYTKPNDINSVDIYYSNNDGGSWNKINNESVTNEQFVWNVPSEETVNAKIKVVNTANASIEGVSDKFILVGAINVNNNINTSENVTVSWNISTNQPQTKSLELSGDNFVTSTSITNNLNLSGNYSWSVPTNLTGTYKLRIRNNDTNAILAISNQFFIRGGLSITSSVTGFQNGDNLPITWSSEGLISNIKIESKPVGGSYSTVIESTPNDGSYIWSNIPIGKGSYIIKLSDASDSQVFVESAGFTVKGKLQLSKPDINTVLTPGQQYPVSWSSSGGMSDIKMEYSLDAGSNWLNMINNSNSLTQNDGTYTWTVPDTLSDSLKVRISDPADLSVNSISPNTKVTQFNVYDPVSNENLTVGSTKRIRWYSNSSINAVDIYYQAGNTTPVLIAGNQPNLGFYDWTVVDIPSNQFKIIINNSTDAAVTSSSAQFNILNQSITISNPYSLSSLGAGSTTSITWTTNFGVINNVDIYYSIDNFTTSVLIADNAPNTGTYNWIVPNLSSTNVRVRIIGNSQNQTTATTDNFMVSSLILQQINNEGIIHTGKTNTISWTAGIAITQINLYYSIDNQQTWNSIASNLSTSTSGSYNWVTPANLGKHLDAFIKIENAQNANTTDVLNSVDILPTISYSAPADSDMLAGGNPVNIEWTNTTGIDSVNVSYYTDNILNLTSIDTVANNGSYTWNIPEDLSGTIYLVISDADDTRIKSYSFSPLSINGKSIKINDIEDKLVGGKTLNLSWNSSLAVLKVRLAYSIDNFANETNIIDNYNASGQSYSFTLPDITANSIKFRVYDYSNPSVFDETMSSSLSKILVKTPNGGEIIANGEDTNIEVDFSPSVSNVDVYYYEEGDDADLNQIADELSLNTINWNTGELSGNFRMKAIASSDNSITDISDNFFTVVPLKIDEPSSSTYSQALPYNITWKASAGISSVNLYYSSDNFVHSTLIASNLVATNESYTWNIPQSLLNKNVKLKVENSDDISVNSITATSFSPVQIQIIAPVSGGELKSNSVYEFKWSAGVNITSIDIAYSSDNFVTQKFIISNLNNNGSANIQLPNETVFNLKFRFYSSSDHTIFSETQDTYTLKRVFGKGVQGYNSQFPRVSKLGNNYALTWRDTRDGNNEIYFAVFDEQGEQVVSDKRITNDDQNSDYPSITNDGNDFMISWQDRRYGSTNEIMVQKVAQDGTLIGSAVRVTNSSFESRNPHIVRKDDSYLLVFQDNRDGSNNVYFTSLNNDGTKQFEEVRISQLYVNSIHPRVTVENNTIVIVYSSDKSGGYKIYAQSINADGSLNGDSVQISENLTGNAFFPDIIAGSSLGVTWSESFNGQNSIKFVRLDDDYTKLTNLETITEGAMNSISPSITYNSEDQTYSLCWVDFSNVNDTTLKFTRIDSEGEILDGNLIIVENNTQSTYPFIVDAGWGKYAVAWNEINNGQYNVYFSLFDVGNIINLGVKARPEKRFSNNYSENFNIEIRRAGLSENLVDLKEFSVDDKGDPVDDIKYSSITVGSYDIAIKSNAHLKKKYASANLNSFRKEIDFTEGNTQYLNAGDIDGNNGNNVIDMNDIVKLDEEFFSSDDRYDLNKDGVINSLDYSIIISNLSLTGDE